MRDEKEYEGSGREVLWMRPEGSIYCFCPCNSENQSVTWLYLSARETGKCSPCTPDIGKLVDREKIVFGGHLASPCQNVQ